MAERHKILIKYESAVREQPPQAIPLRKNITFVKRSALRTASP
jgi:hypothetical protein